MALQLTPLAVALQGIGYGTFLTAVQGLAVFDEPGPPVITLLPQGAHGKPRRRARRLIPLRVPSQAVLPEQDEEELALKLLGML